MAYGSVTLFIDVNFFSVRGLRKAASNVELTIVLKAVDTAVAHFRMDGGGRGMGNLCSSFQIRSHIVTLSHSTWLNERNKFNLYDSVLEVIY